MRRSHTSPIRLVDTLAAASLLGVCGVESTAPEPAPVVDPGASTAQLQVDFGSIEAIRDCDGIEGDCDFSLT